MAIVNEYLDNKKLKLICSLSIPVLIVSIIYSFSVWLLYLCICIGSAAATHYIFRQNLTFQNVAEKLKLFKLYISSQQTPNSADSQTEEGLENEAIPSGDSPDLYKKNPCENWDSSSDVPAHGSSEPPWTGLFIPQKVDDALTDFIDHTLAKFIYTWYRDLTEDEIAIDELRNSMRYLASQLFIRLKRVDISEFIVGEIIPVVISHLIHNVHLHRRANINHNVLDGMEDLKVHRTTVHRSLIARNDELEYCQKLSQKLLPHLVPESAQDNRLMRLLLEQILSGLILLPITDKVCDPDIVNNLIIVFCDPDPSPVNPDPPSELVELLSHLSVPNSPYQTFMSQDLCRILDDQLGLISFMEFMKLQGSIQYLQFFTSLENFKDTLLTSSLSSKDIDSMYKELCTMHRLFCEPDSPDYVPIDPLLSQQFLTLQGFNSALERVELSWNYVHYVVQELGLGIDDVELGCESITVLRQGSGTDFLSSTYDYLYNRLDKYYLPHYRRSLQFYAHWYGKKHARVERKSSTWSARTEFSRSASQRLSVKKKTGSLMLKNSGSTGSLKDLKISDKDGSDSQPGTPDGLSLQDEDLVDASVIEELHDLSEWKVELPSISIQPGEKNDKKPVFRFTVRVSKPRVHTLDQPDKKFLAQVDLTDCIDSSTPIPMMNSVFRTYSDFYSLEAKLRQFHGDKINCSLPSRKIFVLNKDAEFLDEVRPRFEEFSQSVLSMKCLHNSELLHSFLTAEDFSKALVSDIRIEAVLKSVPRKLVKERGQNLIKFLRSLHSSTQSQPPKPDFTAVDTVTPPSIIKQHLGNPLYERSHIRQKSNGVIIQTDNHLLLTSQSGSVSQQRNKCKLTSISEAITRLADEVFMIPRRTHWILASLLHPARNFLDHLTRWFIQRKLNQVLEEHRLAILVNLLTEVLYKDEHKPRTDEEKLERRNQALTDLQEFFPGLLKNGCSEKQPFDSSVTEVVSVLQHPKLNKQLVMVLLDMALEKLFPEVGISGEELEST